jgi:uncharacterized protein YbgA (DUF1722 family)
MSEAGAGSSRDASVRPRVGASSCRLGEPVTEAGYRDVFQAAMNARASRGRNANALHHAFSRLSRELGDRRRADLLTRIESYRRGTDPLSVPIAILAHYASDGGLPWLAEQTYLAPFPDALRLRHSVPR